LFVVIMCPRAFAAEWVQSELQRAKRKQKVILPLLLEGHEPWLSVESTQFYDVRGEKIPDARFFETLKKNVSFSGTSRTLQAPKGAQPTSQPLSGAFSGRAKTFALIVGLFSIGMVCALCLLVGIGWSAFRLFPRSAGGSPTLAKPTTVELSPILTQALPAPVVTQIAPTVLPPAPTEPVSLVPVLIKIPAGEFSMGSTRGDPDEKPVHPVYLETFFIDKFEVTNAQYKICVEAGVCKPPDGTRLQDYTNPEAANYPVARVDWYMAKTFCEWRGARLPTEAEWEKAARGTDGRTFPWGEQVSCDLANYLDCGSVPQPVGSHPQGASPYGVEDLAGNVYEWVADFYSDIYYASSPAKNPTGPQAGTLRVIRGGAWGYDATYLRSALRFGYDPTVLENDLGVRCAQDSQP
jgi:formylglycine-generating enzyme required for sulfatase activity